MATSSQKNLKILNAAILRINGTAADSIIMDLERRVRH